MSVSPCFGFLNIHKPSGKTSRWADDRVKRLVRPAKVGHAGTLDPLASGVLVVGIGQATRLMEYFQQMSKNYRAEFLLGRTSPTEDIAGEVTELVGAAVPGLVEIEAAAERFVGEIQQRPPAFSAVKVGGHRAYKLARKGHAVHISPRPVTIHRLKVLQYEYPRLTLEICCSSGTYIRSLGRDIAQSLGTGAVMAVLVRTAIGNFRLEDSIDVTALSPENLLDYLLPPRSAVENLSTIALDQDQLLRIVNGLFIPCPANAEITPFGHELAGLDDQGNLAAILLRRDDGQLGPVRNFLQS